jgi:hypothetical protein
MTCRLASGALALCLLAGAGDLNGQACLGGVSSRGAVLGTHVTGHWPADTTYTMSTYGVDGTLVQGLSHSIGAGAYTGNVSRADGEHSVHGLDLRYSRSMIESYLQQQVVCLSVGAGLARANLPDPVMEFGVPFALSFGIALGTDRIALTPYGLIGGRLVIRDGVGGRPDSAFGLSLRLGPLHSTAALHHNFESPHRLVMGLGAAF